MRRVARLGGVFAACLPGASAATAAPVVVGMTLPLSGPEAPFGAALRDGAQLAIARAKRSFDLPGMKVQFGPAQRQPRPFVEINLLDAGGRLRY